MSLDIDNSGFIYFGQSTNLNLVLNKHIRKPLSVVYDAGANYSNILNFLKHTSSQLSRARNFIVRSILEDLCMEITLRVHFKFIPLDSARCTFDWSFDYTWDCTTSILFVVFLTHSLNSHVFPELHLCCFSWYLHILSRVLIISSLWLCCLDWLGVCIFIVIWSTLAELETMCAWTIQKE